MLTIATVPLLLAVTLLGLSGCGEEDGSHPRATTSAASAPAEPLAPPIAYQSFREDYYPLFERWTDADIDAVADATCVRVAAGETGEHEILDDIRAKYHPSNRDWAQMGVLIAFAREWVCPEYPTTYVDIP